MIQFCLKSVSIEQVVFKVQSIMSKLKIAVIGSGIAGLTTAWLLSRNHVVTVYEKNDKFGGHSNTRNIDVDGKSLPIDTGFIVYNTQSYPNLMALFKNLRVASIPTSMSFSVSMNKGRYEYSGTGCKGLFGQASNIIRPKHWRMILDIVRFLKTARQEDLDAIPTDLTLGDYLANGRYGGSFVNDHILPMAAAIWSTPSQLLLDFPVASFIRFFANHGLLQIRNRPQWRTVKGGSQSYVQKIIADTRGEFYSDREVLCIRRSPIGVLIKDASGWERRFDHVVIATHADRAIAILDDANSTEQKLLGSFAYSKNSAILHTDRSFMPRRKNLWSSWNYISEEQQPHLNFSVTYWMNRLQALDERQNYFVTLNPSREVPDNQVLYKVNYTHPIFSRHAINAQKQLWKLQGQRRTWFCGSYFGYGFHEDGLQSGLAVAEVLGGTVRPWNIKGQSDRIYLGSLEGQLNVKEAAE